ncbi:MAG: sulfite exporter TauE/SafE family protein [Verrucomicrobiales bacterium]|nr:sulfite exporter TauE/SafE family protein [Verrucomicrobiales bacterium]
MEPTFTITAALATGLITSLHCVGMCGPVACVLKKQGNGGEMSGIIGAIAYHGGRLIAYSSIGAVCGALGEQPLRWIFNTPAVVLPWMLVGVFLITAMGWWKRLPRPEWLNKLTFKARLQSIKLGSAKGGFLMGIATPLLPCGPLYLLFAACLLSGGAVRGAEFALAFGIGTVPLLWLAQESFVRLQKIIPAARFSALQRGLAIVAVLVMSFRLHDTIPFLPGSETIDSSAPKALPSCCHSSEVKS